ncbi:MAG: adenylyl cyclase [Candidatus Angelobacter sp. Gp1-AA117]|nr:MAG: adenylyl cyclase [Candidatus Angelobacter sp. Gp1-AA117]
MSLKKVSCRCLLLLLLIIAIAVAAAAQNITGSMAGTVKDSSGAVVPNATVTVTNTDTGVTVRTLKTDATGNYSAPLLPIGHYSVSIEAAGFRKFVQKNIELNVNDKLTVSTALQVGASGETVTVEANPVQVDLQSAAAVGTVTGIQIQELALNTRNYEQLVTLLPGVSSSQTTDQLYVGAFAPIGTNVITFSVNGARTSENNWTIDGFDNVDRGSNLTLISFPSVDAISEFKVVRGAYDPEFGRSGGAQVNVVTASGTNTLHGRAYEFFRNDVLTANNFFNKRVADPTKAVPRPPLRYNNFGWTLGGPLTIPHVYNAGKDKTFFFFSEEFRRTITYANPNLFVPTAGERSGTFADNVCVAFNASGTCTATGKQIASISPVAQQYIKDIFGNLPSANDATDPHLFRSTVGSIFNYREEMLKIDHVFGPRLTITGKYLHDSIPTTEPLGIFNGLTGITGFPGVNTTSTNSPGHQYSIRSTSTLSPTLLFDGGYGYSYGAITSDLTGIATPAGSPDIKVPLLFTSTLGRIPSISFGTATGSPTGIGGTGPYRDFNTNHSVFGGLTKIMGRHTFKAGGVYYHYTKNENSGNGNQGIFTINTAGQPTAGNTLFERVWSNFLLGRASNFRQDSVDLTAIISTNQFEFYAQDEFRVKSNLSLTYGLRYSNFRQPTDANNKLSNFDPRAYDPNKSPCITLAGRIDISAATCPRAASFDPLNGFIVAGKNSPFGDKVSNEDNKNFAPRIGLVWDPFKDGKMAFRTGYGIFYDSILFGNAENDVFLNPALNPQVNIPNTTLDNPANAAVAAPSTSPARVRGLIATPYHTPYVQQWSLDTQYQFAKDFLLDVGYYGSKGTHLPGIMDINQPLPNAYRTRIRQCGGAITTNCIQPGAFITGATTPLLNQIRPFLGYGGIDAIETIFNSNYNSLQVNVQKRFHGNSLVNVAYTWAKSLTDNQTDRSTAPQDSYCIACDYGPSQQDRRHVFTANYVYDLPFFKSQQGVLGHFAGGWELAGIITYQSGLPFTVSSPFDADPTGQGCLGASPCAVRPDLVGNPNIAPNTLVNWFNTSAFAAVPAGQFHDGTAGRGVVRGPGFGRWDLSLYKNLKITERVGSQFRLEAFNVFNHANYTGINTSMSSSTFGQVNSARDPRIVQLGMKVNF